MYVLLEWAALELEAPDKDKIIQRYSASEIKEHTQIHTG